MVRIMFVLLRCGVGPKAGSHSQLLRNTYVSITDSCFECFPSVVNFFLLWCLGSWWQCREKHSRTVLFWVVSHFSILQATLSYFFAGFIGGLFNLEMWHFCCFSLLLLLPLTLHFYFIFLKKVDIVLLPSHPQLVSWGEEA